MPHDDPRAARLPADPLGAPSLEVHTPEAIAITRALAGFGSRVAAISVDGAILGVVLLLAALGVVAIRVGEMGLVMTLSILPVLYFTFLPKLLGETPGKRWLGIRVVLDDGRPATLVAHFLRAFALYFDALVPMPPISIGVVMILLSKDGKRLGDFLAGTVVVRDERHAAGGREPFWNETYDRLPARTVELPIHLVRALRSEDLVILREYYARRPHFSHAARVRLRGDLVEHFASRLALGAIPDPDAFLHELYLCLRDERSRLG